MSPPSSPPRVLLVYANPAQTGVFVPPYGLERLASVIASAGARVHWCLPFLEADPDAALEAALVDSTGHAVDLVLFSVRNLDDGLVVRSELGPGEVDTRGYVRAIRPLIRRAVAVVGMDRVGLGGGAVSAGGFPVVRALGARWGVRGPAEDLVGTVVRGLVQTGELSWPVDPRVLGHGLLDDDEAPVRQPHPFPLASAFPRRHPHSLDVAVSSGAFVPVQVSAGCDRRCHFCSEASFLDGRVRWRPPELVAQEVANLVARVVTQVWLAGSELNVPTDAPAIALLRALRPFAGEVEFRAFLQPAPLGDALLDALQEAGLDPAELPVELGHLDPGLLRKGAGPANIEQIVDLVERFVARGHARLMGSILLGAHPEETLETVDRALEIATRLDAELAEGLDLSVAVGARVYAQSPLGRFVRANFDDCRDQLYTPGGAQPREDLVEPVVFCKPMAPRRLLARVKRTPLRGGLHVMNTETPATADEERLGELRLRLISERLRGRQVAPLLVEMLGLLDEGDPRRDEVIAALAR